jgi:hypothetical protein
MAVLEAGALVLLAGAVLKFTWVLSHCQREYMPENYPLPLYRRRWVAMLAAIAVFMVLLLVLLPHGISYGMHKWLLENGGEDVSIEDIDVNLFNGRASIHNMQLYAGGEPLLTIPYLAADLEWRPLFSRQVVFHSVRVDGVELLIEVADDGSLRIGGIELPEGEEGTGAEAGQPWHVGIDQLDIANTTIDYLDQNLQLETRLDELSLKGIRTWATDVAPLVVTGALNGAAIALDGSLPPLSQGFGYSGRVHVSSLDLGAFAALVQETVGELEGQLSIDTQLDVRLAPGKPPEISQHGAIRTNAIKLKYEEIEVAYSSLGWEGSTRFAPASGGGGVQANGNLKIGGLSADTSAADKKIRLASLDVVNVTDIALGDNGDLAVNGLTLSGAVFARNIEEEGGSVLSAGAIDVDRIQITGGNQVEVGTMEWRDTVSVVRREPDGVWRPVRIVNTLPFANRAADKTAPDPEQPAGRISVGMITVTGNSAMVLIDETVKPAFNTRIDFTEAHLRDIDNARPEQHSPITLKGRIGKHSRIDVGGTMQPFTPEPGVDLTLQLEGIALTQLSPYMVDAMGYVPDSGHLDANSTLKLNKGQLDAGNRLTIRGLELSPAGNESQAAFDAKLPVPLNTALNMLRDKHDTIALELPVSGDVDNPDFDISDVVNTAVSKALKKGSMTYLKLALQPYGALITLAELAGEAASKVRLEPVLFDPGSALRQDGSAVYLGKVAGILAERPDVNIKVCGVANDNDRATLLVKATAAAVTAAGQDARKKDAPAVEPVAISDEQLLALAADRAGAITDYLVSEHGVTASRLVACQPAIDSTVESRPRVDLLI